VNFMTYRKGDPVCVKSGTPCPDFPEFDIGGWQGRVVDLTWADDPIEPVIGLALDSITLRSLPEQYFEFPLADLAAVDEDLPNAQPIRDYRVWFVNR